MIIGHTLSVVASYHIVSIKLSELSTILEFEVILLSGVSQLSELSFSITEINTIVDQDFV